MVYHRDDIECKDGCKRTHSHAKRFARDHRGRGQVFHCLRNVKSSEYLKKRHKYFSRSRQNHRMSSKRALDQTMALAPERKWKIKKRYQSHRRHPESHTYHRHHGDMILPISRKPLHAPDERRVHNLHNFMHGLHTPHTESEKINSTASDDDEIEIEGEYKVLSEVLSDEDVVVRSSAIHASEQLSDIESDEDLENEDNTFHAGDTNASTSMDTNYASQHILADIKDTNSHSNTGMHEQDEEKDKVYERDDDVHSIWQIPVIEEAPISYSTQEGQYFQRIPVPRHCKPVPSYWNPTKCSKSENDNFVATTIKSLMKNGGSLPLDTIKEILQAQENVVVADEADLKCVFQNYSNNFGLEEDDNSVTIVHCKTTLTLCPLFSAPKPKSCNETCNCLHACPFHILSRCDLGCHPSRHFILSSSHTIRVLRSHLLHKLKFNNLRLLLRNTQTRYGIIFPQICSHYNVEHGCRDMARCSYIHVCKYIMQGCKFGENCKRSHDVYDEHNGKVLKKYSLEHSIKEDQIKLGIVSTSKLTFSPCTLEKVLSTCKQEVKGETNATNKEEIHKEHLEEKKFDSNSGFQEEAEVPKTSIQTLEDDQISSTSWTLTDQSAGRILVTNQTDTDDLEKKYQEFCRTRYCKISIDGVRYDVDMVTMRGKKDNSSENDGFLFKRIIKQSPDFIPLE